MKRWMSALAGMGPLAAWTCVVLCLTGSAWAVKITMKDGRVLSGRYAMVDHVAEDPDNPASSPGEVDVARIVVLHNSPTRTFVSFRQVAEINERFNETLEKIRIRQNVARSGARIGSVGTPVKIDPFDEFGRRLFTMNTPDGPVSVVQGITEITPVGTTVEGLSIGGKTGQAIIWKMQLATSSLPRNTISRILSNTIDPTKIDERLAVVRLYLQSERYEDAAAELEQIQADFPQLKPVEAESLATQRRLLKQLSARRLLREIQLRTEAGQHQWAIEWLRRFPSDDVAGETLQHVREVLGQYESQQQRGEAVLKKFDDLLAQVSSQVNVAPLKRIRQELQTDLNFNTLPRMASFERLADDDQLSVDQRLAIAVSGWLLGSDQAVENLSVATSLVEVRDQVIDYLNEPLVPGRAEILSNLKALEGATVPNVAHLLNQMRPPLETPAPGKDGVYELTVTSEDVEPDVKYLAVLPPEYDPLKRYPAVVTLNGSGSTPRLQLDWWAGALEKGARKGQGTRRGYIVIAVDWQKPHQEAYAYSNREHNAVLRSLRDACRRFAIDTDRVFLSGHSIGGDAAWDIGLAHPDLWAGVIPIVAVSGRYCNRYWENARYVPMYIVAGELDGGKMAHNARDLDRYLQRGFDTTVVEYLGRGHEHFYEDIQNIFDWMGRRRRDFFPREFECSTMRPWDNFFWWVEIDDLPSRSIVLPDEWPKRGSRPMTVSGSVKANNGLTVRSGSGQTSVWLAPELVDFQQRVDISVIGRGGKSTRDFIEPTLEVLLEDARTRSDRQHPFWAKVRL